ncbi:hypothetical protein [Neisseria sp. Ec49-e6-T10]|uniref:hypothetical protein n=1 Tax=Neisseria sp. Ec49-e6-T10 TaxID=3140744 RepID=UPI003EB8080E
MLERYILPKKRAREINNDQFKLGTSHFQLPYDQPEFSEFAQGKKQWLSILEKAVEDLKRLNLQSELFHKQAAQMPFVVNVSLFTTSRIVWPKVLPVSINLCRTELFWTVYLPEKNGGRTRGNKKPLTWSELFELMKQQGLNYDEMLCHYRAHLIMINLNKRIRIAEHTIKQAGEMVELIIQTEPEFESIPEWVDIKMK